MVRFEEISGVYINIDRIRDFYRPDSDPKMLVVEMDNGEVYRDEGRLLEEWLKGSDHITQVIPCPKTLYARYRDEDKTEHDYPVHFLGLCADGYVRPLDVRGCESIGFADEPCNYIGLYEEALHREHN